MPPTPLENNVARTKALLGAGARLSDYLSASLLARVVPAQDVHAVLNAHGCNSQRTRSFPAVAGVYYCMALSLYPEAAYEEVFCAVAQGLAWAAGAPQPVRVAKSSISELRSKIGAQPLADLIERCCLPLAEPATHPQAFYQGLRVVAMDGSNFELPDEPDNVAHFGYPGSRTGHAGYPQAQCAVLVECATHAILAAHIDSYRASEWSVCEPLLARMDHTMLCLADRGFNGFEYWRKAQATGAQLLWRCANNRQLPVLQALPDGSYLSQIHPPKRSASQRERTDADVQPDTSTQDTPPTAPTATPITVRVIEYAMPGLPESEGRYRLMTSLLDPATAPALELAALYHERWQVEAVFDELKTHLLQGRRVLRSKKAQLVRQEFYGWVLAHYSVRWLLHQGAARQQIPHERQSFSAHLQLLRQTLPQSGAFPPTAADKAQALV